MGGDILVKGRKRKEDTDHFGDKKENEREYWEERKEESTLRKKRLSTRYVFSFLLVHSFMA